MGFRNLQHKQIGGVIIWLVGWLVGRRRFISNEDVTIDGLQKGFKAFEQGEIFIVPHHAVSVFFFF